MRLLVWYVARVCIIHNTGRAILGLERRGSHVVEAYDFDCMYVDATHTQLKFNASNVPVLKTHHGSWLQGLHSLQRFLVAYHL